MHDSLLVLNSTFLGVKDCALLRRGEWMLATYRKMRLVFADALEPVSGPLHPSQKRGNCGRRQGAGLSVRVRHAVHRWSKSTEWATHCPAGGEPQLPLSKYVVPFGYLRPIHFAFLFYFCWILFSLSLWSEIGPVFVVGLHDDSAIDIDVEGQGTSIKIGRNARTIN